MRYSYLVCLLFPLFSFAQIDHWESVVLPGDDWGYLVPTAQPATYWNQSGFDSSSWSTGPSGFGYGDEDDATVIFPTMSVYLRKTFEITDAMAVGYLVLYSLQIGTRKIRFNNLKLIGQHIFEFGFHPNFIF